MEYKRYEGESEAEVIFRICKLKEQIGTWEDVKNILNNLLDTDYNESTYRKKYQCFKELYDGNQSVFANSQTELEDIMIQKRELEKAKIQFRDERNAWNKQNYLNARVEEDLNKLGDRLCEVGKEIFEPISAKYNDNSSNDLLVCLSDMHIGETFSNCFGRYDSKIAELRLYKYLEKIVEIGLRHKSENVYVQLLGDQISGNIHLSIQVSNRENVIEQVKLSAELITNFVYQLSTHFKHVYLISVVGNHSRLIADKHKDIKDERLDDLVCWAVEKMTDHIDNVTVLHTNLDNSISRITVRNKTYIGIHGDMDSANTSSIGKLCMMIGEFPYAVLAGHMHCPASNEFNGVKFIQSGSLAGSGDDYTVSKRLSGAPNQTVLVCDNNGIECIYNVCLC